MRELNEHLLNMKLQRGVKPGREGVFLLPSSSFSLEVEQEGVLGSSSCPPWGGTDVSWLPLLQRGVCPKALSFLLCSGGFVPCCLSGCAGGTFLPRTAAAEAANSGLF